MTLRSLIDKAFAKFDAFAPSDIVTAEVQKRFSDYFFAEPSGLCTENVISDECLFRDYSRLGSRKVDFARVRNPFTLSKFTVSSYEKTWFIRGKAGEAEGPFNSYDMDTLFKKEKVGEETLIGVTRTEFFTFRHFIEIVYPLPKVKQSYGDAGQTFKGVSLYPAQPEAKITKIVDESDKGSARSVSVDKNAGETPFKRTPFKNVMLGGLGEGSVNEHFVQVESKSRGFNSDKKNGLLLQSGSNVGERFLVKSSKHNRNKHLTMSSNAAMKIEMNDIIGNYTAIKKDADTRQYVDLRTKLDFKVHQVKEEGSDVDSDIEVDFDAMDVEKKK